MHVFILVDLRSQFEFLPQHVRNGSQEAFLRWLAQHGEVSQWSSQDRTYYSFRSRWGIANVFTFPTTGDIYIQGEYFRMRTAGGNV